MYKLITATKGRFEVFDIVEECAKKNILLRFYTTYPKWYFKKFNIEKKFIRSFSLIEYLSRLNDIASRRFKIFQFIDFFLVKIFELFILINLKKEDNFDIFLGHSGYCKSIFKNLDKKKLKILYVASTHIDTKIRLLNLPRNKVINKSYYKKIKKEYDLADVIICQSSHVKESFLKNGYNNIYMNISGVNNRDFKFYDKQMFNENEYNIIFVGSLSKRKGVLEMINIFNNLNIRKKKLYLIGHKTSEININKLLNENIIYLGYIKNNELYKYYSSADLLLLLSSEEGLSMVLGQCLSCGTPVISNNMSGAQHFIDKIERGILLKDTNFTTIQESIYKMHTLKKKIRLKKDELSRSFIADNSWKKNVDNLNNIILNNLK